MVKIGKANGVTLIELLVAMAVIAILMACLASTWVAYDKSFTTQAVAASVQQTLRAALELMSDDIRMAGFDPTETADAGIVAFTGINLQFTSDRNANGSIDESDTERITYAYDAANQRLVQILYESTPSEDQRTLIDNVTDFAFIYLDADGVFTADVELIRRIIISITVQEPAGRGTPVERTLSAEVACRNLGL